MPTAVGLIERLDEVEGLVVIAVADEKPAWVPERLRAMVLTPADAKGLEYQSVCVLDPGRVLARLEAVTHTSQALRNHEHRTAIDQLRVALSRATETLAFVDVADNDDAYELSEGLLEGRRALPGPTTWSSPSPMARPRTNACRRVRTTRGR